MWRSTNYREVTDVQRMAIKLVGATTVVKEGVVTVEPAHGVQVLDAVARSMFEEDGPVTERLFREAGIVGPGADDFRKYKKIVRAPADEGGGLHIVTRIPGLADDDLSNYSATTDGHDNLEYPVVEERALQYKLNILFSDTTLQDKLGLSSRRMQAAKRVATSDPGAAARSLTDAIQMKGFPKCRVVAGDYARSMVRAKEVIHQWADAVEYRDTAVPSVVTVDKIFMTYNAFEGPDLWSVHAPLKYATEAQCIYQLAIHYGPQRVMFLIGLETAMLNINIHNEQTGEYYTSTVMGYSSVDGIVPLSAEFPRELTAEQKSRLYMLKSKVLPVEYSGAVVGTAVRVSDRHVLLNSHTIGTVSDVGGTPVVADKPVDSSRSVAFDLSVIDRKGGEAQWTLRDPAVGERVILIYSVGKSVEYSEVLRVLSVHQDTLILSQSNVLRKGASGAVVVSLRDFAMLGMFVSLRGNNVVCASFSARHFTQITEADSVYSAGEVAQAGGAVGDVTYNRMLHHGLGSYLDAINSAMASLHVKQGGDWVVAGTVANYGGAWYTTVDPRDRQLYLGNRQPLLFESVRDSLYRCIGPPPILSEVPSTRMVEPGERVCIMARNGEDVIMSQVSTVTHYTVGATHFTIEGIGSTDEVLAGGLIISERDAAVLGQYVKVEEDAFGEDCGVCVCANTIVRPPKLDTQMTSHAVTLCTDILVGAQAGSLEDERHYRALGTNALGVTAIQKNRERGLARQSLPLAPTVTSDMAVRMCKWLVKEMGSNVVLASAEVLHDRAMWVLGVLYAESRHSYECAVEFILPPLVDPGGDVTTPTSAIGVAGERGASASGISRTYSTEIVELREELGAIRRLLQYNGSDV